MADSSTKSNSKDSPMNSELARAYYNYYRRVGDVALAEAYRKLIGE